MGAVSKEPVRRARFSPTLPSKQFTISPQTAGLCSRRVAVVVLLCESSCLGRRTSPGLWHLEQHVTMDKERWRSTDKIAVWVLPQKAQAAFSSSCLLRNFSSGLGSTACLSLCFPLKLFLRSLHLAPTPGFLSHIMFWVAASYICGREGEKGKKVKSLCWNLHRCTIHCFLFLFFFLMLSTTA